MQQHPAGGLDDEPRDVGRDQHAAPVAAIGDHAADEREHQERDELRRDDEADRPELAAGLQHRERERDQHDPVADDRQHLTAEQQPELRLDPQDLRDPRSPRSRPAPRHRPSIRRVVGRAAEELGPGATIVTVMCDTGMKYQDLRHVPIR